MKFWPLALGAWFILTGLSSVVNLSFKYESMVMGVLAIVVGVLVVVRR